MGTRADFYVGRGPEAEWLGSVAWDGYPDGFVDELFAAPDEDTWRLRVARELGGRNDATLPDDGWPWPWETSATTDYAYTYDDDKAWASSFGSEWFTLRDYKEEEDEEDRPKLPGDALPRFSTKGFAQPGTKRSGVMLITEEGVVNPDD